ncbi:MAG: oligoribonuclease [Burkholderiaceae bacterium]
MSQPDVGAGPSGAGAGGRPDPTRLVWIDLEMTGLLPDSDRIIEIAVVVTDADLNTLAESEAIAIHQPDAVLDAMDAWNTSTHARTGLTERVRASRYGEETAEAAILAFLAPWVPRNASPMCGNSICQDRRFLARHMPTLEAYFHYRNLDVSTLKELCRRWRPEIARRFGKRGAHTAIADIRESIAEMAFYREHFLRARPEDAGSA